MPRERERQVVRLVCDALEATVEQTPAWLVRPGRHECARQWSLIREIYHDLTGLELPSVMPPREWRQVDAVLAIPDTGTRILEFDESQHFNTYRALTLGKYVDLVPLGFPAKTWIDRCRAKARLEGGGFGRPKPPLFPGEGGRHRQRAFRDALADLLPLEYGFGPTLRIGHFEVSGWLEAPTARVQMRQLLSGRLDVDLAIGSRGVSQRSSRRLTTPSAAPRVQGRNETAHDRINAFLQSELLRRGLLEVTAVVAASWLDEAGLLPHSSSRPGLPLRKLLRAGEISGAEQRPPNSYGRWFIRKARDA